MEGHRLDARPLKRLLSILRA